MAGVYLKKNKLGARIGKLVERGLYSIRTLFQIQRRMAKSLSARLSTPLLC